MSVLTTLAMVAALTAGSAEGPRRIAVLVGSNEPVPGRGALRYAHRDAQAVADVLVQAGEFRPGDVHLLLDPSAEQVLERLDTSLQRLKGQPKETLLFFYYSGHADDRVLYVKGSPLPLNALRERLDRTDSSVRVGVLDACHGGGWTRAKGLVPGAAFEVDAPLVLSSEGSVLIASSSGLENAHEAESLQGSFFTHHFVAALRGAADSTGDGLVTVNEAYAYAKERTIRDTAILVEAPQHPSFSMNLRGRAELPLTALASSPTRLTVAPRRAPLQLIHLTHGRKVLELPAGKTPLTLAVPPGRYLVRRKEGTRVFARMLDLRANEALVVEESSLTLEEMERLAFKGQETRAFPLHRAAHTTLPARTMELAIGLGVQHGNHDGLAYASGAGTASFTWGVTDRLQLHPVLLAATYRWGGRGGSETLLTAGTSNWGFSSSRSQGDTFILWPSLALEHRQWVGMRHAFNVGVQLQSFTQFGTNMYAPEAIPPDYLDARYTLGYSYYPHELLTLNLGVTFHQTNLVGRSSWSMFNAEREPALYVGSVQSLGGRTLPLLQLHLGRSFTLFGDISLRLKRKRAEDSYVGGVSWVF